MRLLKDINNHIHKHPIKYLGLAAFCKVMIVGLFAAIGIQAIQHSYAEESTWTITASAEDGGSIDPNGTITVNQGSSQTFTLLPNTDRGFGIEKLLINEKTVYPTTNTYTFNNIQNNHTIIGSFKQVPTVKRTEVICPRDGGKINNILLHIIFESTINDIFPHNNRTFRDTAVNFVSFGERVTINLGTVENKKYYIDIAPNTTRYTQLYQVLNTHKITIPFEVQCGLNEGKTHTINIITHNGGTTSPNPGEITVQQGSNLTINIIPNPGYTIDYVAVNPTTSNSIIEGATRITLNNINNNMILHVFFKPLPQEPSGGRGSVTYYTTNIETSPTAQDTIPEQCNNKTDITIQRLNECLGLTKKAAALAELNNKFIRSLAGIFTNNTHSSNLKLSKILQQAKTSVIQLNNTLTNRILGKQNTQKLTNKKF